MGSGNFVPGRYVKYIVIAFVLALVSNAVIGWLLQGVSEIREQVHDLDTEVAVLNARVQYLTTVQANSQTTMESSGGYNAAEPNATKGSQ